VTTWHTRFAPSPTGHLHLGHVLHFITVEEVASKFGADISFRLEDHDQSRCRPEFYTSIIEDLRWLGFKLPHQSDSELWRQSTRHQQYQRHLENLMSRQLIYACACSRKDVQAATDQNHGELRYPGTCRGRNIAFDAPNTALRLVMPDQVYAAKDYFLGDISGNPIEQCGDMIVRDRLGQWTYQFCVVIDDLDQGINLIIRGMDLLASTARQLALREMLAPGSPEILFAHHPLIANAAGEKLSKRLGSESIAALRAKGLTAANIRALALSCKDGVSFDG
jgi:glutamyl-Q tRNA(Asp) synthetase